MKVLAFGATNSRHSINKQLAHYVAKQIPNADISLLDLNDFEMPIYSEDRENEQGIPAQAQAFFHAIGEADLIVVAFAEHNGSYTAAYKNLFDWASRIDGKVFQHKPVIMLATSPGPSGAQSVLTSAQHSAPYFAAEVKGTLSLPSFHQHFDPTSGLVADNEFNQRLDTIISHL
ncbi:NADPH-dependent FMN reductase [Salinivibrio sp. YCSC6]|uniref:NADPH-dependent FMN reductase n=1 Tax=Salinivibrio sp. YCSC6 TaxID=2003370 RepID=UPI000BBB7552|nr:NAD(P)H-dependent oxidoreductase [Salinivibrio sp. YCSC6]PCE65280.1 NADPH-dependent FMN reductase [Salinivibrio sp. YCSC6]QCF37680.1 NADPH-dependent oxidoreductase [Salinivibrio sp. YCSC6]